MARENEFIVEIKRFLANKPDGAKIRDIVRASRNPVRNSPAAQIKSYLDAMLDKDEVYQVDGTYFLSVPVSIETNSQSVLSDVGAQSRSVKTLSKYADSTYKRVSKKLGTDNLSEILIFLAAYWEGSHSAATLIDPSLNFEPDEMP